MTAGMLAPNTPKERRHTTGNGTPRSTPGFAIRLVRNITRTIPTSRQTSTCHAAKPRAKRLAANR